MVLRFLSRVRGASSKKKKKESSKESSKEPSKEPSSPDVSVSFSAVPETEVKDYGYGGGSPTPISEDDPSKYEYGNNNLAAEDASKYGYGDDASPETAAQYGYGDATPSDTGSRPSRTPRRSSMKQGGSTKGRRSSIGCTGEIELTLPGRKDPVRRRTSIAFSEEPEVKEIERVSTLTDDSKALWFQKTELQDIKTKLRTIISTVERGDENSRKLCTRGLECHIGQSTKKTEINAAWDAVAIEQYTQQNKGNFDDETISNKYKTFSKSSQEKASERAREDEAAIAKYQLDTRRRMRRMSM
jgi:hypothetical protein